MGNELLLAQEVDAIAKTVAPHPSFPLSLFVQPLTTPLFHLFFTAK
jgi:hypothetical protein